MSSTPARRSDERGVVLVWLAITLVLLLGVTAFSIDVAYWQVTKNREQRAADAAALAGAVTFPNNPTQSNTQAQGVAADNGYDAGAVIPLGANDSCPLTATTTVCTGAGDKPYQYKVTVAQKVNNYFGGIFGIHSTTVRATAQAEYIGPLKMGSPSNQFGNDPDAPVSQTTYPNFWANVAGGNSPKANGDAYAADSCDGTTDGCSNGTNLGYNPDGYFYTVDFKDTATVDLQAFDPGFVGVGDSCTNNATNGLLAASNLANVPGYPASEGGPTSPDIHTRYLPVTNASNQADPGYRYCSGDMLFANPAPATTYTVLKTAVPGSSAGAQQVCSVTYPGYSGNIATALAAGTTVAGAPGPLVSYFRQWVTLCPVTGQAGDQYLIEVSTDRNSSGHNRFSLRGETPDGDAAPVAIAGNAYMGIYANVGQQLTQFYLARVPSAAAGHTLVLNFFDIGDAAANSQGTLQVVPPLDSKTSDGPLTEFNGCQWTGGANGAIGFAANTTNAPWGTLSPLDNTCTVPGVHAPNTTWNGQWSTVTVPIPTTYSCNDDDALGCWLKINYHFTGGVNDTTSWNASLLGDPVRLVK